MTSSSRPTVQPVNERGLLTNQANYEICPSFSIWGSMPDSLDYTDVYREKVRPEINRRLKRLLLSLVGCVLLLIAFSMLLEYLALPDKLIFLLFFPCAAFYLYEIFSFRKIRCPNCNEPLFSLANIGDIPLIPRSYVSKHCPHCAARLR